MSYLPSINTLVHCATYALPIFRRNDSFWEDPLANVSQKSEVPQNSVHQLGIYLLSQPYLQIAYYLHNKDTSEDKDWVENVANNVLLRTYEVAINTFVLAVFFVNFLILPQFTMLGIIVCLHKTTNEWVRSVASKVYNLIFNSSPPIWLVSALIGIATWPFLLTVSPFILVSYAAWDQYRAPDDKHYFLPINP